MSRAEVARLVADISLAIESSNLLSLLRHYEEEEEDDCDEDDDFDDRNLEQHHPMNGSQSRSQSQSRPRRPRHPTIRGRQPRTSVSEIPRSILDDRVEPIRTALANIDAHKLLDLELLPFEQTTATRSPPPQTTITSHYHEQTVSYHLHRQPPHNLRNTTPHAARGPRVRDGVYCRPICDQIRPTLDIDDDNDDDDVAMGDNNNNNKRGSSSVVRYLHIAEVPDEYTIGIFVFGPHEKIPLHDHPEMCVLSRVLYGDLERLSLDLDRKGRTPNNDEDYDFVFGNATNDNSSSNNNNSSTSTSSSFMDTTDEDDPNNASSSSIRHLLEHKTQTGSSVENPNHSESSSSSVFMAALSRSATWLHDNLYSNNNTKSGSCTMDDEGDPQHPYHYQYNNQQRTQQQRPPRKERFPEGTKVAYRNATDLLEAPNVASLYPYEGNLHEFVAGPYGAAVLDVLLPPYDDERKRDCTFYNIRETTASTQVSTIAIQPTSIPTMHRGDGVSNATATSTVTATASHPSHEELDRSVPPLSSHGKNNNSTIRVNRQPCLIVPTGQPENFHCISGRYKDLGDADDYYDSQCDDD